MTFRELLKLYKNGELPNEQKEYVESEIEKHEAIGEYLYDDAELSIPSALSFDEREEENKKQAEDFTRIIKSTIRRAFIKMGISVGTVVLAAVLAVMFVLPDFVSSFYYDPNKVVGVSSYNMETTKMALDLSVFTELFLAGRYRNDVIADAQGYGSYHISIPETASYDGKHITVSGKLEKGRLTLYDPNLLSYPAGNAFVLPEDAWGHHGMGAAGSAENAFAKLETLDDTDYYTAYFSLTELMDYESFYAEFGGEAHWCAAYLGNHTQAVLGFSTGLSGSLMDWDRETYPRLCILDGESDILSIEIASDAEGMQMHFLSMLRYMEDHPEVMELFDAGALPWDMLADYVEENGLVVYGFTVTAKRDTIMAIAENDMISYVYTKALR